MRVSGKALLTWFPRVLAGLFALFTGVFALDSFEGHAGFFSKLGHLALHLIPTAAVLLLIFIAWNRRIIGGLAFLVLGMVFTIYYGTWMKEALFCLFSLPLFIAGIGFIFSRYAELGKKP